MKFSFTTFSMPRSSLVEVLASAIELGYDGIEPRLDARHAHGIELETTRAQRNDIRRRVEDSGIELACISTPCRYSNPAQRAAQMDLSRRYIDLAADVGCRRIRAFGGEVPEGLVRDAAQDALMASLREIADHAHARKVTVCLETHDSWCDTAIMAYLMREIDHPAIGVTWDVMHTQRQGHATPEEAHRVLRPWIRHVHIHDGLSRMDLLRLVPIGTGDFDHAAILRVLRDDGYDGFVSGEWIESIMDADFRPDHLRSELATLKRLLAE